MPTEKMRMITDLEWQEYQTLIKVVSAMNESLLQIENTIEGSSGFGEHPGTTLNNVKSDMLFYQHVLKAVPFDRKKYNTDTLVKMGVLK